MNSVTATPNRQAVAKGKALAAEINRYHAACILAVGDALKHAMDAGDRLIEAKAACQHGEWSDWLAGNFNGADRTARAYMRLAANREKIEKMQNGGPHAVLTIDSAMQLIAGPPKSEPEPPATGAATSPNSGQTAGSYLEDPTFLPKALAPGYAYRSSFGRDGGFESVGIAEIVPMGGFYYHLAVLECIAGEIFVTRTRRPIFWTKPEARPFVATFFPDRCRAAIEAAGWRTTALERYRPFYEEFDA